MVFLCSFLPFLQITIIKYIVVCRLLPRILFDYEYDDNDNDTGPLETMCRRCMEKTILKTSTRGNRLIRDVAERLQSEAPDTCLKDLCSIHSRV